MQKNDKQVQRIDAKPPENVAGAQRPQDLSALILTILFYNHWIMENTQAASGYAPVNGLQLYYEIHGAGNPLVLIHGGGSTIDTSFGRIWPQLARHFQVIAVELQAHGRTRDIDRPLSFEQDADDVAALMQYLQISKASFWGFSNGANTAMQIAIRHAALVNKLVLTAGFYQRSGIPELFWEGMAAASISDMPQELKDAYLSLTGDEQGLMKMFHRDVQRMQQFTDWTDDTLLAIKAPTLLMAGDQDIMRTEHTVAMHRLISNSRLAILPGVHGACIGEITTVKQDDPIPALTTEMVMDFLRE